MTTTDKEAAQAEYLAETEALAAILGCNVFQFRLVIERDLVKRELDYLSIRIANNPKMRADVLAVLNKARKSMGLPARSKMTHKGTFA